MTAAEPVGAGMRLGVVILPDLPWAEAQRSWRRAEELGFDHAWTYDHLAWRSLRDSTWFGAVPTLTAAANATERIRLGTLVASPNFRHPVPFATELVTLDDISGGRLTLGIGAGGDGWDATMLGQDAWSPRSAPGASRSSSRSPTDCSANRRPRSRVATTRQTKPAPIRGACSARAFRSRWPPRGRDGMRLAATYGQTWVTNGDRKRDDALRAEAGAKLVGEQMARLDQACADVDREPASLRRLVLSGSRLDSGLTSMEAFRHTAGCYAAAGVTDFVVHWPRPDEPYAADLSTFEHIFSG